ncbi:protein of unknown function DUF1232 [Halothece sp. PCC 7418]|uniref:DUF1232 domain-containing protein n=1 Tax=Halothece sp. (strain PCC 7418) TaxID=65093 RepID=UPI0002A0753F|nr:YkvA family protein [Halothece sp. PCC 7418]AFZ42509.1 protein of unknown function DUF1232 [Halothece sp. PCC 7418]
MSKLSLRVAREESDLWSGMGRLIALIPLILSAINLMIAITLPIFHYDRLLENAIRKLEGRGFIRKLFDHLSGFFWQQVTPDQLAQDEIWWNQTWAIFYFIISLLLFFIIFRWQEAKYFISGVITISFGVIYSLLPIDIFPDFIPAAGSFDDAIALLISTLLGLTILGEGNKRRRLLKKVRSHAEKNPLKALELLCEEHGLEMEITSDPKNK